jgi:Ca2+-binding RTX toxin-like protein
MYGIAFEVQCSGNDLFELTGKIGVAPGTTSRLSIDGGLGNDRVALRAGSEVNGSAVINLGAGDDELALDDLALVVSALFNGGTGSDKYYGTLPRTGVTQTSFETLLVIPPPF